MSTAEPFDKATQRLIQGLADDVRDIKDVLVNFTNDGFPLRHSVPTSELVTAAVIAAALIGRSDPRIHQNDLMTRIAAAQEIATEVIRAFDAYQGATRGTGAWQTAPE